MVKRRAAPNPEAMMIAVRFAGGRRVDGEEEGEDGDEEVFMVFFFFFFSFYFFLSIARISSRELFVVVVVVAFLFCDRGFFLLILSFQKKFGRSSCWLFGWLVGSGFSFFW